MKHWLFDEKGRVFLGDEYGTKARSTYNIAAELGVYPNLVRRALKSHGIPVRDRSEAQSAALSSGRHVHPTEGRSRTEEERQAIRDGVIRSKGAHEPNES